MSVFVHIARRVSNLDQSVKWYCDHFGFVMMDRSDNPSVQIANIGLPGNKLYLELIWVDDYDLSGPKGLTHFAIGVPDITASCDKLEKAGLKIRKPVGWREQFASGGTKAAFIDDPDGYSVELLELSILPSYFSETSERVFYKEESEKRG